VIVFSSVCQLCSVWPGNAPRLLRLSLRPRSTIARLFFAVNKSTSKDTINAVVYIKDLPLRRTPVAAVFQGQGLTRIAPAPTIGAYSNPRSALKREAPSYPCTLLFGVVQHHLYVLHFSFMCSIATTSLFAERSDFHQQQDMYKTVSG
jgi:hypothetical protein